MGIISIADSLDTDERIAIYWQEVKSDFIREPRLANIALGEIAHARTVNQLAKDLGIDREELWTALSGEEPLSIQQINCAANLLGLEPLDRNTAGPV